MAWDSPPHSKKNIIFFDLLVPCSAMLSGTKVGVSAMMNSGNFEVVVWGSQQLCTPAWQSFIRGLMQLKYSSFKWTRKTRSHWVVKSGCVYCMSACVCACVCVFVYYFQVLWFRSLDQNFRLSSKRLIPMIIFLNRNTLALWKKKNNNNDNNKTKTLKHCISKEMKSWKTHSGYSRELSWEELSGQSWEFNNGVLTSMIHVQLHKTFLQKVRISRWAHSQWKSDGI